MTMKCENFNSPDKRELMRLQKDAAIKTAQMNWGRISDPI
jgi:hypothetical protein